MRTKFGFTTIIFVAFLGATSIGYTFGSFFDGFTVEKTQSRNTQKSNYFDAKLLSKFAETHKDPNDISDIPDRVIIEDFINIAFSKHDWASDYPWYHGQEIKWFNTKGNVWAYEVIDSDYKTEPNRINKFTRPVRILPARWFPKEKELVAAAESYLEDISEQTGRPVSFLEPKRIFNSNFEILIDERVFPFGGRGKAEPTPAPPKVPPNTLWLHGQVPLFYYRLNNAVKFTPDVNAQVTGTLIKNKDSSIKHAICDIGPTEPRSYSRPELQFSLLAECLIRAHGLHNHSLVFKNSVLGYWGEPFEAYIKERVEKMKAIDKAANSQWRISGFAFFDIDKSIPLPRAYTKYDLLMLSILYHPMIKPGMTAQDVRAVLPDVLKSIR